MLMVLIFVIKETVAFRIPEYICLLLTTFISNFIFLKINYLVRDLH
jgi:hypothetical protein